MAPPVRVIAMAVIMSLLQTSHAQTYTTCNPLQAQCPADAALGRSMSFDFRTGQPSDFSSQGSPTFGSDGVSFTVAKSGDSPQLTSKWYIMFGRVDITLKAAPGAGIVSSSVLQSDDLDEIDWEWVGALDGQVQSNYFGKGQTTSYDRGAIHNVQGATTQYHKYTVDWTQDRIVWQIDGVTARVLYASNAAGQYPQTPMQFKFGAWSAGDPSNAQGTIEWAKGPTDYSKGPFTMVVQSIAVTDYSTGTQYQYGDTSGSWQSIKATGGQVNGNAGGASGTDTNAPAITSTTAGGGAVPFDGQRGGDVSATRPSIYPWVPQTTTLTSATVGSTNLPGLPPGWSVNSQGKVVPPSTASGVIVPLRIVLFLAGALGGGFLLGIC